jgi:hypothetical protein
MENLKERHHLGDLGVDENTILNRPYGNGV